MQISQVNKSRLQPVSGLLAALLVKYPDLQYKAQRALLTYLRSIHKNKDKEIFDVTKLNIGDFSASLGLAITPKIRFLNQKVKANEMSGKSSALESESSSEDDELEIPEEDHDIGNFKVEEGHNIGNFKGEEMEKSSHLGHDTTDGKEGSADIVYVIFFFFVLFCFFVFLFVLCYAFL